MALRGCKAASRGCKAALRGCKAALRGGEAGCASIERNSTRHPIGVVPPRWREDGGGGFHRT